MRKNDWAVEFLISQGHEIDDDQDIAACTTPLSVTLKYLRAERARTRRLIRQVEKKYGDYLPLSELRRRLK